MADELKRISYELERAEEGRRRLRAALTEQRTAAERSAEEFQAQLKKTQEEFQTQLKEAHCERTAKVDLLETLRAKLEATAADEHVRAYDLSATVTALQLLSTMQMSERQATKAVTLPPASDTVVAATPSPSLTDAANVMGALGLSSWLGAPASTHEPQPAASAYRDAMEALAQQTLANKVLQEQLSKPSLDSLLQHALLLLKHRCHIAGLSSATPDADGPMEDALQIAEALQSESAAAAGTVQGEPPQSIDEMVDSEQALRLVKLVCEAAASMQTAARSRAEAARELRDLGWQIRTLAASNRVEQSESEPAAHVRMQGQAREAALSSELLALERQLAFVSAPNSEHLQAVRASEQNAASSDKRAKAAEDAAQEALARAAAAEQDAAKARASDAAALGVVKEWRTRAEKAEARLAEIDAREAAKARAEAAEDGLWRMAASFSQAPARNEGAAPSPSASMATDAPRKPVPAQPEHTPTHSQTEEVPNGDHDGDTSSAAASSSAVREADVDWAEAEPTPMAQNMD